MHPNELALKKLVIRSDNLKVWLGLGKHITTLICVAVCVWIMIAGFTEMTKSNPASLNALARVVKEFSPSQIISWLASMACGTGWFYERKGKKRLLNQTAPARKKRESKDAYNATSGLTETGDTPNT